jgi:hypothetical protein
MDNARALCQTGAMWRNGLVAASILSVCSLIAPAAIAQTTATFADVPVTPGATVRANVPLSAQQQSYVSEGGNPVPPHAIATLAVPPGFTPNKSWPVLVVLSTSDFKRQNHNDLADFYRDSALAEGWLVLAGDGPAPARRDTAGWRAGTTLAAIDALHRSFPGSKNWPVACAGFSGGAKRAGTVAPLLALAGCRVTGIFLTGINEERLSEGYLKFQPGAGFLRTPIFLSSGARDNIATPQQHASIKSTLERTGFTRVRLETFPQGHAVKRDHIRMALRWFRGA